MKIIGVTGSFGTGKTTVSGMFKELGAIALDADGIAHKAIKRNGPAYKKILKIFGNKILKGNKEIDRRHLGALAFCNKALLKKICGIIHPVVIKDMKKRLDEIKKDDPAAVIVLDVPLLIEAGLTDLVDTVVVVKARQSVQVKRCQKKTGLGRKEILARIMAQMPINQKVRFSDFVIDNDGARNRTKREVKKIWEQIQQQAVYQKEI